MLHRWRLLPVALVVAWFAVGCSDQVEEVAGERNPLTLARGKPTCTTPEINDLLDDGAFANGGLTNAIGVHCGQVERADTMEEKVEKALETIDQILELAAAGQVNPVPGMSVDEVVEALLSSFFDLAGIDPTDMVEVKFIEPSDLTDGLEDVVIPNGESALQLSMGDLAGPVVAAILPVMSPAGGGCPFSFDPPEECYPQAWDWSFTPIENVVGDVDGWLCLDSRELPAGVPESRIEIASEDENNPGTLVFWGNTPEGTVPADFTDTCPDEEIIIGSRPDGALGYAWDVANLFRVTPAYARPGRLGASIGAFSVFTPADPGGAVGMGTISGEVTSLFSDCLTQIGSVSVIATNDDTEDEFVADTDGGTYSVTVPFGTYTVEASADGFVSESESVVVDEANETQDFCLQLVPQ